ncbi:MAG TPA: MarR family transcriptional regulator [Galbitalea sp.]|nr:MarR family transcriptional regulator [Galbitalea sp.]
MRPAEELRYAVLALQREGNRNLIAALRPLGVTPAQAEVIRVLSDYEPLTLTGLGELLICESGTGPSRLVDRLVATGAIHRTTNPDDRRSITLALTPGGRALSQQIATVETALYSAIDAAMGDARFEPVLALAQSLLKGSAAGAALDRRRQSGK